MSPGNKIKSYGIQKIFVADADTSSTSAIAEKKTTFYRFN